MGFLDNVQEAGSQFGQVLDPTQAADPQLEQNLRENPGPTSAFLGLSDRIQGRPPGLSADTDTAGYQPFAGTGNDRGLIANAATEATSFPSGDGTRFDVLFGVGILALLAVAFGQLFNINLGGGR